MKSIVIIAILSLIAVKLSFSNENVYYQYLWQQYLSLWDPDLGSNIDMRRVLNKATTNPSLGSKEAKEIIKQGKKIVPFIMFKKWVIRYVKYNSCNSIGSVRNVIFSGGSYPQ